MFRDWERENQDLTANLAAVTDERDRLVTFLEQITDQFRSFQERNTFLEREIKEIRDAIHDINRELRKVEERGNIPPQKRKRFQDEADTEDSVSDHSSQADDAPRASEVAKSEADVAMKDQDMLSPPETIGQLLNNLSLHNETQNPPPPENTNEPSSPREDWGQWQAEDPDQAFYDNIRILTSLDVLPEYAEEYLSRANNDTNVALNDYFDDERDAQAYIYLGNEGVPVIWRQRFLDYARGSHAALTLYRKNEANLALLLISRNDEEAWQFLVDTDFVPERFREKLEEGTRAGPVAHNPDFDRGLYDDADMDDGSEEGDNERYSSE